MEKFGLLHIGKTGGTAASTVIKANNQLGVGQRVKCFGHKIGLTQVNEENLCDKVIFFIREPASRYISSFNSRLRKGLPRHFHEWGPEERVIFETFKTPNQLAEALSDPDLEIRRKAIEGMKAIRHLRRSYAHFLGSIDLLERMKDRIYFIAATEHFEPDFGLLRRALGISPDLPLPVDELGAHRTPDGFEKTVSELGRKNVLDYYADDCAIYEWCARRREELIAIRTAELNGGAA